MRKPNNTFFYSRLKVLFIKNDPTNNNNNDNNNKEHKQIKPDCIKATEIDVCLLVWLWKSVFVYLPGGECRWAAVSSIILAVGPVVYGVTPAVPSKRLDTSYKQETLLWLEK